MAILTTTDQGLNFTGGSSFIKTGTSTVMSFTTSGEVGIGIASPATKLHVVGRARFDDTQINAKGVFADYFSSGQSLTLNSGASASILFKIGNTTSLTLDSSENATFAGDVTVNGKTVLGNALTDKAIVHGHLGIGHDNYPKIAYPGQNALWSGSGSTTGQIVIDLPGTLANFDMTYMEIDIYEYSTKGATKLIIGGHNWNSGANSNTSTTQWYNVNVQVLGALDKPVYFGRRNDGTNERRCIAIGETNSTWSYATVQVHKVHGAEFYVSNIDWVGDWNINQTTSGSYFTKNPTTNFNSGTTLETNGGISANGATFAGDITTNGDIIIDNSSGDPFLKLKTSSQEYVLRIDQSDSEKFQIRNTTSSVTALSIDASSNATFAGNVGIGEPSPDRKLHVNSGTSNANTIFESTDTAVTVRFKDSTGEAELECRNDWRFSNNAGVDERMRITSAGEVLIGRTSNVTSQKLQVNGYIDITDVTESALRWYDGSTFRGGLGLDDWATSNSAADLTLYGANNLHFVAGGGTNKRMTILSSGEVGIGTTSPDGPLHLKYNNGTARSSVKDNNTVGLQIENTNSSGVAQIHMRVGDGDAHILVEDVGSNATDMFFSVDGTEPAMTIKNAGNVGIGTTSPSTKLQIGLSGSLGSTTNKVINTTFDSGYSTTNSLQYQVNAHVGTTPSTADIFTQTSGEVLKNFYVGLVSDTSYFNDSTYSITQGGVQRMVVKMGGNVGIGTTSPDSKLDVNVSSSNVTTGPALRISKGASPIGKIRYDTVVIEANDVATIRIGESDGTVSSIMSGDSNLRINSTHSIKFFTAGTTTGEAHNGQGGSLALTLDNSQNATFAGTVTANHLQVTGEINSRNNTIDDETLFAITDHDTDASIRAKFDTTSTAFTKVDDSTAPASGVFKVTGSESPIFGQFIPMDNETEITFECWVKHVSGSDNAGNFYAGSSFYNGSKTYLGNNARYWGSSGHAQDSDNTTWRHIKGVMKGSSIRANSATSTAQYLRMLILFNYAAAANASHFCGLRFYRSKKTVSSLWLKTSNSNVYSNSGFHSTEAGSAFNVIDTSGNIRSIGTIGVTQSDGDYLAKLYQSSADGFLELFTGQATPTSRTKITSYGDSYINPSNGNVSIGTTSPFTAGGTAKLSVSGLISWGASSSDLSYFRRLSAGNFQWQTYNGGNSGNIHLQPYGGNVGIGTTSPSRLLTLENNSSTVSNNSQLRINNIGAGDAYIYLFAGSDWSLGIDNSDSDKFKLCTSNDVSDGDEVVTVDRSGNVGIGTDSPSEKLHVQGAVGTTNGTAALPTHTFYSDNDTGMYRAAVNTLAFSTGSSEAMRINSSGDVGIGTISPAKQLHVRGSAPFIRIEENSTSNKRLDLWVDPSTAIGYIGANQSAQQLSFQTANDDRIRILNNGNVGIGTTSPARKLHVSTGNTDVAARFENTTTNGNVIEVKTSGDNRTLNIQTDHIYSNGAFHLGSDSYHTYVRGSRVGIRTTSPSTTLDINGITTSDAFRTNTSNTDYNLITRNSTSGTLWVQAAQSNSIQTILSCRYGSTSVGGGTEVLAVRKNSSYFINTKLGIGTNNPGKTLDVVGEVRVSQGDLEIAAGSGEGLILKSPNGGRYRVTVNNSGELQTASI